MRLRQGVVALILPVIGGIALLTWRGLPATSEVAREARGQVVSGAKVVGEVGTTSSAGQPVYEIDYVVLDVGQSPARGVRQQAERVKLLRWDVDEDGPVSFSAHSSRLNGLATFVPLRDYLAESNPAPSEVGTMEKLRERFGEDSDLVLVVLQPLDPRK
ncbi:hypothetical protein ABT024_22525 [Streptomyces sp. NPDC002812]|uniref:hypothetical protein n=1 Tax=Streptomyces sp. NPDC002812 TaxID=3154434 RepID=UPI0033266316